MSRTIGYGFIMDRIASTDETLVTISLTPVGTLKCVIGKVVSRWLPGYPCSLM